MCCVFALHESALQDGASSSSPEISISVFYFDGKPQTVRHTCGAQRGRVGRANGIYFSVCFKVADSVSLPPFLSLSGPSRSLSIKPRQLSFFFSCLKKSGVLSERGIRLVRVRAV